ncbi:uncharacterized protein LOC127837579 isoform X3 [Dreissena polymorpha]|nr:uncharacterized protein LOC127837579 isoform X3 [Dreissena polymorpha]XP_052220787.1 uncharacterized protein LOC127837579 isoform X3 [Dreissena polymorpha]
MVNTINKALCGTYYEKAKPNTRTFERFKNCGIQENELQGVQKYAFSTCLHILPSIIDSAGNIDENTLALQEIMELVIGGFIPRGTSLAYLLDKQTHRPPGFLSRKYTTSNEEWKVTKIVFVVSCTQPLPTQLIQCLQAVLAAYDRRTGQARFNIDVFVAITKYDLVAEQGRFSTFNSQEQITMEQFLEYERNVARHFSVFEHNRIRWVSYVDGHSGDNPFIENIALKLVRQMMHNRAPEIAENTSTLGEDIVAALLFTAAICGITWYVVKRSLSD